MDDRVAIGTLDELRARGCLTGKAGSQPICVFWSDGDAYALDDRCPHMGFPLHRGTVESGLVTCHWHNARFDLRSGGTFDPWADDVRAYPVEIDGDTVTVVVAPEPDRTEYLTHRLEEGLEQGITLVTAKAVLGLLAAGVGAAEIVRAGVTFGTRYRQAGWGAGLTVLTAMANVLPHLDEADHALALVQGLAFVSRDTRGRAPRFPLLPLRSAVPESQLTSWYRRFIETRSSDAAERTLASAVTAHDATAVAHTMFAAVTDHVFVDGGHTVDFTNKAFEVLDHLGPDAAARGPADARRADRGRESLRGAGFLALPRRPDRAPARRDGRAPRPPGRGRPARSLRPRGRRGRARVVGALRGPGGDRRPRSTPPSRPVRRPRSSPARSRTPPRCGSPASTRRTTTATGTRYTTRSRPRTRCTRPRSAARAPSSSAARTTNALRVYLDRFLNIPAARLPELPASGTGADLADLQRCWDQEGRVDEAGTIVYRHLRGGGDPGAAIAAIGHALLTEDAEFHWFQTYEAAVRQFHAWPAGSEEQALILSGTARFLAAHTPTRRELSQVVRIATRLRRGEALFEDA